jgi:hypothetical protein
MTSTLIELPLALAETPPPGLPFRFAAGGTASGNRQPGRAGGAA